MKNNGVKRMVVALVVSAVMLWERVCRLARNNNRRQNKSR